MSENENILEFLKQKENLRYVLEIEKYAITIKKDLVEEMFFKLKTVFEQKIRDEQNEDEWYVGITNNAKAEWLKVHPKSINKQEHFYFFVSLELLPCNTELYYGVYSDYQEKNSKFNNPKISEIIKKIKSIFCNNSKYTIGYNYIFKNIYDEESLFEYNDSKSEFLERINSEIYSFFEKTKNDLVSINKLLLKQE